MTKSVLDLIDLVENHPDATAEDHGDHCVLTLHGKHSIQLSPVRAIEKFEVVVRKMEGAASPPVVVQSYDLRAAVIKRMVEIFRSEQCPLAKILKDFK